MTPALPEPPRPHGYPVHAEHRIIHRIADGILDEATIDLPEARALTLAADETLIIVLPRRISKQEADEHHAYLYPYLGDRFVIIGGDDILLGKIKTEDWGGPVGGQG